MRPLVCVWLLIMDRKEVRGYKIEDREAPGLVFRLPMPHDLTDYHTPSLPYICSSGAEVMLTGTAAYRAPDRLSGSRYMLAQCMP